MDAADTLLRVTLTLNAGAISKQVPCGGPVASHMFGMAGERALRTSPSPKERGFGTFSPVFP
jgi:hypothetical protein